MLGLFSHVRAQGPPPRQCVGGKAVFAVSGDSASTFRYSITGGVFLDTTRNDSLVVQWNMEGGLQTIGVQEVNIAGCEGDWVFMHVDVRGTPFVLTDEQRSVCTGTAFPDINPKLFKSVKGLPETGTKTFTQPGEYKLVVEDMFGCKFKETIKVTPCTRSYNTSGKEVKE